MLKRLTTSVAAIFAWLVVCGIAFLIIVVGGPLFMLFITVTLQVNHYAIQILIQSYYVIMGLLFLGFFILMEHLLIDKAASQGILLPRTLFMVGIEILVIGVLQLGVMAYAPASSLQILLMGGELVLGAGLVYLFRRKKIKKNAENL